MLFKYYPEVKYDGKLIRDFTRHISFISDLEKNPYVYLPYTLEDGDRPEDIAYHYYGDVVYTPYVLMANNVVNPYLDWLLTTEQLDKVIMNRYKEKSGKTGTEVLRWAHDATRFDNIVHFIRSDGSDDTIMQIDSYIYNHVSQGYHDQYFNSPETVTYTAWTSHWVPVRIYDWENQKNEEKRVINLVDDSLIEQVHERFKNLIAR